MANEDAGRKSMVSATEDQDRARATGSRKPGVMGRMMDRFRNSVERIRLPRPDWRTFAWGLLLLIAVIFIVRNWAPLRINFFGWYLDAPRAVVFAVFFALGMVTTWLIEVRNRRAPAADEDDEEPIDEPVADQTGDEELEEEEEVLASEPESVGVEPMPEDLADEPVEPAGQEDSDIGFTPIPEDDGEVNPEPEAFAEVSDADAPQEKMPEDEEPEDASVIARLADAEEGEDADEPVVAHDETLGDALSDDYGFDPPNSDVSEPMTDDELLADEDWERDPGLSVDDERDSAEDDADEAGSSEEGDVKPFWRL